MGSAFCLFVFSCNRERAKWRSEEYVLHKTGPLKQRHWQLFQEVGRATSGSTSTSSVRRSSIQDIMDQGVRLGRRIVFKRRALIRVSHRARLLLFDGVDMAGFRGPARRAVAARDFVSDASRALRLAAVAFDLG